MGRRGPANDQEQSTPEQQILSEIKDIYTKDEAGLISIAALVGYELLPPREKITVLMVGNHSAGKSSFINWYVEETVQRTGVAMETSGFTFVTSGKRRETLTGEATVELLPHMKGLTDVSDVAKCMSTEVITSRAKKFPMITFVDSPGLIDGDDKYPYDIDSALLWLGRMADLTFVFFDPIGMALCKHTLDVVEKMCSDEDSDYQKMKFYLSKADTAGSDKERQKVITQMARDLYGDPVKRPGMAKVGTHAEVPTIYIPQENANEQVGKAVPNDIDQVGELLEKQIKTNVQNTLNQLKRDADTVAAKLAVELKNNEEAKSHNLSARARGFMYMIFGFTLPVVVLTAKVIAMADEESLGKVASPDMVGFLMTLSGWMELLGGVVPAAYTFHAYVALMMVTLGLIFYSKLVWTLKPRLTSQQKQLFTDYKTYLTEDVISKQKSLYKGYLALAVGTDHKQ